MGEHRINSTRLLKLAQLYPVYCRVVLMEYIILGNLLIKKVFPMIILNNNKYSSHCTLSWGFFFSSILEIRSISVFTYSVSTNLGKLWRSYCYCLGICGYEHHSSHTAVGLLWSTLAHTSLDGHSNIVILLKMHCTQWQILIPRSGIAEGYTQCGIIRFC